MIGSIFYLAGLGLAITTGVNGTHWFIIFVCGLLLVAGYTFKRLPQLYAMGGNAIGGLFYSYVLYTLLSGLFFLIGLGAGALFGS